MKNEITIIDNFVDKFYFKKIQKLILSNQFSWFYNTGVVFDDDNHYQFTHMFYRDNIPLSGYFNDLNPILKKMNAFSVIRVKANLLPKTEKNIEHGMHIDLSDLPENCNTKTAILYINTNNGYTKFENGEIVQSVENRIVMFDSKLKHSGSTCTDENIRVVINFNYI